MSAIVRLEPGTIFATDFRVVGPLSEGGMGTVYAVDQISTGAPRALKLMHPQLVADEALRRRFEREARISARIESDHVIHVVGAGVDTESGTPWLAMELLSGTDLAAHVERNGPVTPATLLLIFEQLCHALAAAHRMGVVHRDLKPENLFLSKPRSSGAAFLLKVLDFGIAKLTAETTASHTAAVGTPMWMAPEQTSPGQDVAPQTDIWALGLIAFWLLTGRSYWRAANVDCPTMPMFLREILVDEMPPPSARAAFLGCGLSLSPEFDSWFTHCVHRDPKARYATVAEAHEELVRVFSKGKGVRVDTTGSGVATWAHSIGDISSRVAKPMAMTAAPVTSPPPPPSTSTFSIPRRSLRLGLGACAAVAAGGVAVFLAMRSAPTAQRQLPFQSGSARAMGPETSAAGTAPAPVDTLMLPAQTVGGGARLDPGAAPTAVASAASGVAASPAAPASGPVSMSEKTPGATAEATSAPGRAKGVTISPSPPSGGNDPQRTIAEINKVVRNHLPAIKRQCWEPAYAARSPDSPSNARVILSLNISPEGAVQSAESKGGDGFSGLAGCVQSQAMKLRFAPSSGGAVVSVPFVFAAQ